MSLVKRSSSELSSPPSKKIKKSEVEQSNQNSKKKTEGKFGKKTSPGKKRSKEALNQETKLGPSFKSSIIRRKKIGGDVKKEFEEFPKSFIGKDGKPQWDKVKVEKKKLKESRKVIRTGEEQYHLSVKAKSIWEELRKKKHSLEKKEALVNDLFTLLKGQIPNVVHSHDMARVVQWMLKLGSASIRTSICEQLCANAVACLQSKYACFCVKRALKYGSKADRLNLVQACNGHFLKLLSHAFASPVIEMMYSTYASAEQRRQMHRELYGEIHVLLPSEVAKIDNVPEDMRAAILGSSKTVISKLLEKKQPLKYTLFQSVLNDFLSCCSEQDRNEILDLIQGNILELLITKEGSRVALLAVWYATNKVKKIIVKSLKTHVKEIATSETGHIILLALFDSVDDTVLVKKVLIPELLSEVEELARDEWGRTVILYLVAHRDPAYFHPHKKELLAKGDAISKRKKDNELRVKEMLETVSDVLLKKIAEDPDTWWKESGIAMVSLAVLKSGKGESLKAAFESLATYILDPQSTVDVNERPCHVIELSSMHLILKKLILLDKSNPERCSDIFSSVLASKITEEHLYNILQYNRGCFLLVLLFESNEKKVCKLLKSKLSEPLLSFIQKQETTGSKILLTKLAENK